MSTDILPLDELFRQAEAAPGRDLPLVEVAQTWGESLVDTRHVSEGRRLTIGARMGHLWSLAGVPIGWVPAGAARWLPFVPPGWSEVRTTWRTDLYAPEEATEEDEHPLVTWDEGPRVHLREGWGLTARRGDRPLGLPELETLGIARRHGDAVAIRLDPDLELRLDVGGLGFRVRRVPASAAIPAGPRRTDRPFLASLMSTATLGGALALAALFAPAAPTTEAVELPDHFVKLILEHPPEPVPVAQPKGDAASGARAAGEEGARRIIDDPDDGGASRVRSPVAHDRQVVKEAGILGALAAMGDASGALSASLDPSLTARLQGLHGPQGVAIGGTGLGRRGLGPGGGGEAEGLDGLGTHGIGGGDHGFGREGSGLGDKPEGGPSAMPGEPLLLGALDRSLVDEVVKRHMSQIRYCYQRELPRDPSLAGKVTVKFTIAADGSVSSAKVGTSSLGNEAAEACMVQRFYRMRFPEPRGGGVVSVSYPFLFAPG